MRQILETVSRWPEGKPPPRAGGEDFPSTAGVHGPSPLSAAGRTGRRDETPAEKLAKRDKVNLDIFWLKDETLGESANLPAPEIIAADLEAALEQFATIA